MHRDLAFYSLIIGALANSAQATPYTSFELAINTGLLQVMGDLGIVAPMPYSPRDVDSVRRAVEGSDIVINLIGKDYETSHYLPWLVNYSFEDVNVKIPEMLAKISVEMVS